MIRPIVVVLIAWIQVGCATDLVVEEIDIGFGEANGIVVNTLTRYAVDPAAIELDGPLKHAAVDIPEAVDGVDHDRLLRLDIDRDLFASGTLKIELTPHQTLKKVEIESTPGTVGAVKAAATAPETRGKLEDAK